MKRAIDAIRARHAVVGLLALGLLASGVLHACASDPIRQMARVSREMAIQTEQVTKDVIAEHTAGRMTDADYLSARDALDRIAAAGLTLDQFLRALDAPNAHTQVLQVLDLLSHFILTEPAAKNPVVKASLDGLIRIVKAVQ